MKPTRGSDRAPSKTPNRKNKEKTETTSRVSKYTPAVVVVVVVATQADLLPPTLHLL